MQMIRNLVAILLFLFAGCLNAQNKAFFTYINQNASKQAGFYIDNIENYALIEVVLSYNEQNTTPLVSLKVNEMEFFKGNLDAVSPAGGNITFDITDLVHSGNNVFEIKNISPSNYGKFYLKTISFTLNRVKGKENYDFQTGDKIKCKQDYFQIKKGRTGTFLSVYPKNPQYVCVIWDLPVSQPSNTNNCPDVPAGKQRYFFIIPKSYVEPISGTIGDKIPPDFQGFDFSYEEVASGEYYVKGKAKDNSGVYAVFVNRIKANDYSGTFALSVPLEKGTNIITVSAYDKYFNKTTRTKTIRRTLKDTEPPEIKRIISPESNFITIDSNIITIEGQAGDNTAVKEVVIFLNNYEYKTAVDAKGFFKVYNLVLNKGENKIKIFAKDIEGNESQPVFLTVNFNPLSSKPKIELISPVLNGDFVVIPKNLQALKVKVKVTSKNSLKEIAITKIQDPVKFLLKKNGNNIYEKEINLPPEDTVKISISATNIYGISNTLCFSLIREKQNEQYPNIDDAPLLAGTCDNCFALIIANSDYSQNKLFGDLPYARNDGEVFKKYLVNVLKFKEKNITYVKNAGVMDFIKIFTNFTNKIQLYPDGKFVFYYTGHGDLDKNGYSYVVPTDYNKTEDKFGFLKGLILDSLFYNLTKYDPSRVVVFLDMCYSGTTGKGIFTGSPTNFDLNGNIIVFSAAGKSEAFPFEEKNHSLFTYALLKVMHDYAIENKNITNLDYGTLFEKTKFLMKKIIVDKNLQIKQEPAVYTSFEIEDIWRNWKLP